jgi:hypothetical protein
MAVKPETNYYFYLAMAQRKDLNNKIYFEYQYKAIVTNKQVKQTCPFL